MPGLAFVAARNYSCPAGSTAGRTKKNGLPVGRSRYVVVLAVAATHIALIAVLVAASRGRIPRVEELAAAVVFFLPQDKVEPRPPAQPKLRHPTPSTPPLPQNVPAAELSEPSDEDSSSAIHPDVDWDAEAQISAANIIRREAKNSRRAKDAVTDAVDSKSPSRHSWFPRGVHSAGEEESHDGQTIEWVNDHCHVAVDSAPPGMPDFLARARMSHSGCKDPSEGAARGDLFDQSQKYRKYHADE
jgi:hypothetical protein